jgi:hypothetical protein
MKIRSSKEKTRHILVRITPYAPFGEEDDFIDFAFLYFYFSQTIQDEIKSYHKKWESRELRIMRFPIELFETILISTSLIINADNFDSEDYKYIKFDALNYLEQEPIFEEYDKYYKIMGRLLCSNDYFEIDVERIPDGWIPPSVIYRRRDSYSKLIH